MRPMLAGVALASTALLGGCPPNWPTVARGGVIETWDFRCAEFALNAAEGVKVTSEHSGQRDSEVAHSIGFDAPELKGMRFISRRKAGEGRIDVSMSFSKDREGAITPREFSSALEVMRRNERDIEASCKTTFTAKTTCINMECPSESPEHD